MIVRAKFTVVSNMPVPYGSGATITLSPVISGSVENESFYSYTPGGSIQLSTVNQTAADQFVVGKTFYVDFIPDDIFTKGSEDTSNS